MRYYWEYWPKKLKVRVGKKWAQVRCFSATSEPLSHALLFENILSWCLPRARDMLIMMLLPGRAVLRFPTDFPPAPLEKRRRSCGQLVSIIGLNWSELGCWFWQCDNGMTMGMHRQSLVEASAKALSHCYLSLLWNETCASLCVWTFLRLHRALALFEREGQHLKHHEPCFGLWFYLPTSFERAHLFERCQPKDPRIRAARLPFTGQHDALLCKFRVFTIHENCPPLKAIRK